MPSIDVPSADERHRNNARKSSRLGGAGVAKTVLRNSIRLDVGCSSDWPGSGVDDVLGDGLPVAAEPEGATGAGYGGGGAAAGGWWMSRIEDRTGAVFWMMKPSYPTA